MRPNITSNLFEAALTADAADIIADTTDITSGSGEWSDHTAMDTLSGSIAGSQLILQMRVAIHPV